MLGPGLTGRSIPQRNSSPGFAGFRMTPVESFRNTRATASLRRPVEDYFKNVAWKNAAIEPLKFTNTADQVDVMATVKGGGAGGQSGAVRMGISRALSLLNPELRHGLRKNGFLTRDSRMRERKKYGQKGARKRFQFSKR